MRVGAPDGAVAKVREWNQRVPLGTFVHVAAARPFDAWTASLAFLDDFSTPVVRVAVSGSLVRVSSGSQGSADTVVAPLSSVRVLS